MAIPALTVFSLLGQGINILGASRDKDRIRNQEKLQTMAMEVNAEGQRTQIMSKYTDIFEKQASDIASQSAIFANAGVDRASSLFRQGMRKHEKNFLDSYGDMKDDMKTINTNLDVEKARIGVEASAQIKQANSNIISGLVNAFTTWNDYNLSKKGELLQISGGSKPKDTGKTMPGGEKVVKIGTKFREMKMLG